MGEKARERPILFSGPMVRAILDGRKTQTRRIVKPQPNPDWTEIRAEQQYGAVTATYRAFPGQGTARWAICECPFGTIGDRLWVRETWRLSDTTRDCACYEPCHCRSGLPMYRAESMEPELDGPWKPSIHMPRWVSRITLEITGVRVERLNEISEADAEAEGVMRLSSGQWADYPLGSSAAGWTTAKGSFGSLWKSVNRQESWDANPWVWVIQFERAA